MKEKNFIILIKVSMGTLLTILNFVFMYHVTKNVFVALLSACICIVFILFLERKENKKGDSD